VGRIEKDVGRRKADVDHHCLAGHSLKGEFDAQATSQRQCTERVTLGSVFICVQIFNYGCLMIRSDCMHFNTYKNRCMYLRTFWDLNPKLEQPCNPPPAC